MTKKTVNAIKGKQGFQPTGSKTAPTAATPTSSPVHNETPTEAPDYDTMQNKIPTPNPQFIPLNETTFENILMNFPTRNEHVDPITFQQHATINWEGDDYELTSTDRTLDNGDKQTIVATLDPDSPRLNPDSLDGYPAITVYSL